MINRDNQQQTATDMEIGWLSGMIEGEGSICLQIHRRKKRNQVLRVTPRIIITNTDQKLIEGCVRILEKLNIGKWVRHTRPNNVGLVKHPSKNITYVHISGLRRMQRLLKYITNCLCGEKRERAEILQKFINGRLQKPKCLYEKSDIDNIMDFLTLTKSKNKENIRRMLNEYTQGIRDNRMMMYSGLARNSKKPTEMIGSPS